MIDTKKINQAVANEVINGLSRKNKSLPSWLFYDEEGDKLFQQIMNMPEYYLTDSEYQIFQNYKADILSVFTENSRGFNLIEFGAGDGMKTEVLLKYFTSQKANFTYKPVDISASVLDQLANRMKQSVPDLSIEPINKEYFSALEALNSDRKNPMIVLFMGANIGNFALSEAKDFVRKIAGSLRSQDQLMIGFDLKKNPNMILDAYNDAAGITTAFNMNLLTRLNRELEANFELDKFMHYPYYDPQTGTAKSFIVSKEEQTVSFNTLNESFDFKAWEPIHVEFSQKFDEEMIAELARQAGLSVEKYFYDNKKYFADVVLKKV
ncbi:L-histidine N(alpha)-methyltransferase [Marivirga sp. S37H4]|uniref:L-histidine N(Alpha)-methyltransferase n=1 Tax=Marivirga aurantiaca TaxID=2802615 RepID=A0A934X0L9_9BACT|nr:L-histidine N(alpha)-methyltransferase [Marivirga aurantiaca]MBK6266180.1 L-histidine N(alpha)-methyltransferase [Marivirga aurantiaca]